MPVPKKLKEKIRRAINKEYADLSLKRRKRIINAIIYHKLKYGKKR